MIARAKSDQVLEHRRLRDMAMRSARQCIAVGAPVTAAHWVRLARVHSRSALRLLSEQAICHNWDDDLRGLER